MYENKRATTELGETFIDYETDPEIQAKLQEMGLGDWRDWDNLFIKYLKNEGPMPPKHPWPDHIWNTNPEMYNFEYKDNFYKEQNQKLLEMIKIQKK